MPKIIEYNPSSPKLNPNDRALQAWETAGRRVGPLYNQAAQDIRQAGAVKGEMEKAKAWPFDIYALEASGAPQIHNTTSTETRATKSNEGFVTGFSMSESRGDGTGLLVGNGTSQGSDYAIQRANAGYDTTPESAANDWISVHGEGSAGAVGMSRMARAAAAGHNLNRPFVRGGTVDFNSGNVFGGGPDDIIDTASGNIIGKDPQVTEQLARQARAERDYQENRAYTQAQRKQAIDDRYQRGVDKWNREQAAADKADWMRFNGPNGFNTRRDQWINGKGGLNDQWQSEYNADIKSRANQQIDQYNAAGKGKENFIRFRQNDPRVIDEMSHRPTPTYTGDAPRSVTGPSIPVAPPSSIIDSLKGALGGMFGTEGTSFGSTLEDDSGNEEDY